MAELIDGSIGEGSRFHATFGYYARAVAEGLVQLPSDWRSRARTLIVPGMDGLSCTCPGPSDVAMSKLAFRAAS